MFRKASRSVCTSTIVLSADPETPTQSSSDIMTPENTEKEPDDPELVDEGDIQM
jgi:hypothetical protein